MPAPGNTLCATGTGVGDGVIVTVGVSVGVAVSVAVGVAEAVGVGVNVAVLVGVYVGVFVGVDVNVGGTKIMVGVRFGFWGSSPSSGVGVQGMGAPAASWQVGSCA